MEPVVQVDRPGKRRGARPPRTGSIMKWLAVSGLAAAVVAVVLKPRKAY